MNYPKSYQGWFDHLLWPLEMVGFGVDQAILKVMSGSVIPNNLTDNQVNYIYIYIYIPNVVFLE
jgi:hypothetical protein